MSADDWQAVGAIGTCAVVVVALATLIIQNAQRRRDADDQAAGQARLIVETSSGHATNSAVQVRVTNYSELPAFDVEIVDVRWNPGFDVSPVRWRAPFGMMGARPSASLLAPGQDLLTYAEFVDGLGVVQALNVGDDSSFTMTYSFLDARGLRWIRVGHAAPKRVRRPMFRSLRGTAPRASE